MTTERDGADIGQFMELYCYRLGIAVFLLKDLKVNYISWNYKRYKNHKVIDSDQ